MNFNLFRVKDLINPGSFGPITTALAIWITVSYRDQVDTSAIALMWVVALIFYLPYIMILVSRAKWLKKIEFMTSQGIAIATYGKSNIDKDEIEKIVEETIEKWELATGWDGVRESLDNIIVYFKEPPLTDPHGRKVTGWGIKGEYTVAYNDNLDKTAFAHEIGHQIHAEWTGLVNNHKAHEFMKEHNLS